MVDLEGIPFIVWSLVCGMGLIITAVSDLTTLPSWQVPFFGAGGGTSLLFWILLDVIRKKEENKEE